jgi:hypothetical protein
MSVERDKWRHRSRTEDNYRSNREFMGRVENEYETQLFLVEHATRDAVNHAVELCSSIC